MHNQYHIVKPGCKGDINPNHLTCQVAYSIHPHAIGMSMRPTGPWRGGAYRADELLEQFDHLGLSVNFSIRKELTVDNHKTATDSEMATGSPANPSVQGSAWAFL
jgi:hypothetical protein